MLFSFFLSFILSFFPSFYLSKSKFKIHNNLLVVVFVGIHFENFYLLLCFSKIIFNWNTKWWYFYVTSTNDWEGGGWNDLVPERRERISKATLLILIIQLWVVLYFHSAKQPLKSGNFKLLELVPSYTYNM